MAWWMWSRHKFSCRTLVRRSSKGFGDTIGPPCFMICQFYWDCRSRKYLCPGSWLQAWEYKFCPSCAFSLFCDGLWESAKSQVKNRNPTYQQIYFGKMHFHIVKVGRKSVFSCDLWDVRKVIDSFGVLKGSNLLDGEQLIGPKKSVMINSELELEFVNCDFLDDRVLGAWFIGRLK